MSLCLGIVAWPGRSERLSEALSRIATWAASHPAVQIMAYESLAPLCHDFPTVCATTLRQCQALLAIGGDGTVLSAARLALDTQTPILGVNTGRIGFLAEYHLESLESTLDMLVSGQYEIGPRIMLDYTIYQGSEILLQDTVLNEVQVQAMEPERMIDLEVKLNGNHLTEYWADSLLVSTPTGSTAYNLSAGGPILHPSTNAFILNPVNPCSLSVRPLVVPSEHCELVLSECNGRSLRIMADGHCGPELPPGSRLVLSKSTSVTRFVQPGHSGFVEALREKLGWTGKPKLKL